MKKWFSLGLLAASLLYTAYGLGTLSLLNMSGRPGAGYFPFIIGVLLIIATAWNAVRDFREWQIAGRPAVRDTPGPALKDPATEATASAVGVETGALDGSARYGRDVFIMLCMLFAFILALTILGGLLSMIVFMLVFLFVFNKGKPVVNAAYSLALPLFLFGLFKVLLNASLPIGFLGF